MAFVGADATGKSTLIADVRSWLGGVFETERFHLGKPTSSWSTLAINLLLPLARMIFPQLRGNGVAKPTSGSSPKSASILQAIRAVTVAWDRHRLARKVHRVAATGVVAICDRYPSTCPGAMDSPRLQSVSVGTGWKGRVIAILARWERRIYACNPPPDVVVKLSVDLDVARQRNALRNKHDKHAEEELAFRHQSFHLWDLPCASTTIELDTGAPIRQTKQMLREYLWNSL